MSDKPIIAIDGPVASGKSTCGKRIAAQLGFLHLDTGALYRAVGLKVMRRKIAFDDVVGIEAMLKDTGISLEPTKDGQRTYLDGEDVSREIRSQEAGAAASAVSKLPEVRRFLLQIQREAGKYGGIVMDGRDIGTVIFPEAQIKFFLAADSQERARRRFDELKDKGVEVDYNDVLYESNERDKADSARPQSPLKIAADAFRIDSSGKSIEETVAEMLRIIKDRYLITPQQGRHLRK